MARVDWDYHLENYAINHAPNGVSKAEYAREYGLNPNTARVRLRLPDGDQLPGDRSASPDRSPSRDRSAGTDQGAGKGKAKRSKDASGGGQAREPARSARSKKARAPRVKAAEELKGIVYDDDRRGHFLAGNNAGMTHGGYTAFCNLDEDIQAVAAQLATDYGELELSAGRYLQMYRYHQQILKSVETDYQEGNSWKDEMGNAISKSQALSRVLFGASKPMTELETAINKMKANKRKEELERYRLRVQDDERHPLTLVERIAKTRELMTLRTERELSALDTARLFELEGLSLPHSLREEVSREVALIEPAMETDGGISDAELERMSLEYAQKNQYRLHSWLPERRQEIAAMLEQEAASEEMAGLDEDAFSGEPDEPDEQEVFFGVDEQEQEDAAEDEQQVWGDG